MHLSVSVIADPIVLLVKYLKIRLVLSHMWIEKVKQNKSVDKVTRSQAVARIASLHFSGSRDVIGHMTIWYPIGHFLLVVLWNQASVCSGFRDIQWRMWRNGWHDLKRPLNKGQGHLFATNRFLIYVHLNIQYHSLKRQSLMMNICLNLWSTTLTMKMSGLRIRHWSEKDLLRTRTTTIWVCNNNNIARCTASLAEQLLKAWMKGHSFSCAGYWYHAAAVMVYLRHLFVL